MKQKLLKGSIFKNYDKKLLLKAVNESIKIWRKNENYNRRIKKRIEKGNFPKKITDIKDLYKIPLVDMAEFKSAENAKDHPLATNEEVSLEYSLYTSGTSSGSRGLAPKSKEGYRIHKNSFQKFFKTVFPDLDFLAVNILSKDILKKLPNEISNRAVIKYVGWAAELFYSEAFMKMDGKETKFDIKRLVNVLDSKNGKLGILSPPAYILKLCRFLEKKNKINLMGGDSIVATAGGWKGTEGVNKKEFRNYMQKYLGITPKNHLDFYGFTESFLPTGNIYGDNDPDKKRIPKHGFVYVTDEDYFLETGGKINPVEEGEPGLAVFIDPLNPDHPGAILTDDIVRKTGGEYGKDVRVEYIGRSSM